MDKYTRAAELVVLLGGVENVATLTHCITRLRITLIDRRSSTTPDYANTRRFWAASTQTPLCT